MTKTFKKEEFYNYLKENRFFGDSTNTPYYPRPSNYRFNATTIRFNGRAVACLGSKEVKKTKKQKLSIRAWDITSPHLDKIVKLYNDKQYINANEFIIDVFKCFFVVLRVM